MLYTQRMKLMHDSQSLTKRHTFTPRNKMKPLYAVMIFLVFVVLAGCGPSYNETKMQQQAELAKERKEDSLALKIGVMPTLNCLPIYVAKDYGLFDSTKADIRLKPFNSQIDCDAALLSGRIEGCVTDIIRGQYMKKRGMALDYIAATNTYWQLISNRMARIRRLKQLDDKMVAMARFSATALLADYATDSVKLKDEQVFKIQINDVNLRLRMLLGNEMDAVFLPEPQATAARLYKNPVLMDSRDKNMCFGVIAFRSNEMKDGNRKRQLDIFIKGYDAACDSINKNGLKHYASTIRKYYKIDDKTINALPKTKFQRSGAPRQKDIDTANEWLK